MSMLKENFIELNLQEKIEYLNIYGELIAEKVYYEYNISLILIENFYVELFYNRHLNQIVGIEIQENNQLLFEYVKHVDLQEIKRLLY
jgi:hypothetical protein